jgi:hypothetical protein
MLSVIIGNTLREIYDFKVYLFLIENNQYLMKIVLSKF